MDLAKLQDPLCKTAARAPHHPARRPDPRCRRAYPGQPSQRRPPPPPSSQRRPGIGLKLAALDHVLEPPRDVGIIGVEYIEDLVQLAPPPVDFENEIPRRAPPTPSRRFLRPCRTSFLSCSAVTRRSRAPRD